MENWWQIGRSQYQMKWTFILWCSLAYYVERVRKAVADVVIFDCWPWRKPFGCLKVLAGTAWQNDAKHLGFCGLLLLLLSLSLSLSLLPIVFLSKRTHATLATLSQPSKKANSGCKKGTKTTCFIHISRSLILMEWQQFSIREDEVLQQHSNAGKPLMGVCQHLNDLACCFSILIARDLIQC